MASRGMDFTDPLDIGPGTQQLIAESEAISDDLDHRVDQSDRFLQGFDENFSSSDARRPDNSTLRITTRPRSWNTSDDDKENNALQEERQNKWTSDGESEGQETRKRRNVPSEMSEKKMSVLEVEIQDEDDLVRALRKSAERMTASPKASEKREEGRKQIEKRESDTHVHQRNVSSLTAARFEDTVSSYELRKRETKAPVSLAGVFACSVSHSLPFC